MRPLAWGEPEANEAAVEEEQSSGSELLGSAEAPHGFDWVVASDVTYSMGAHAPLCWTVRQLLLSGGVGDCGAEGGAAGGCRMVLAHEHRVVNPADPDERLEHLLKEAHAVGLSIDTLATEAEGRTR